MRAAANGVPLGAFIKAKLFDEPLEKVRRRNTNPIKDQEVLGRLLGSLGQSRLSQNLNQLARASHTGALPVSPKVEDKLRQACTDVKAMREELMRALGSLFGCHRLGLFALFGLKAGEEVAGLRGRARSGENRLLVTLHDAQPVVDIGGVVGARLRRDPKISAEERRTDLGDLS